MEKISSHISYKEATRSSTATRKGIKNEPGSYEIGNMELLAKMVFEPLREWVGGPIRINSFFRSHELNIEIGGSKRSQHCEGRAIDIDDTHGYKTNAEMFEYIRCNLNFDTLIYEHGDDCNPDWVHVSYVSEDQNRNRVLRAKRINGKTVYETI